MSGSSCNGPNSGKYWTTEPTAIFVVGDDWGGWFDHVSPWAVYKEDSQHNTICPSSIAPNGWGCGYVSGFRVPLLVVSPYTKPGYVSGALPPYGPGETPATEHDFGSILAYTEKNFGLNLIDQSGDLGYADYNAPDWSTDHSSHVPLSDFFGTTAYNLTNITTSEAFGCFQYFGSCIDMPSYVPTGPDSGDGDQ